MRLWKQWLSVFHVYPVIVKRPRSLIKSFENGLLFQTNNVEDLKDKMEWAFENPEQMTECGKRARRRLLEEYSSDKALEKIQILLDYVKECE